MTNNFKKYIIAFVLLSAMLFVGCNKSDDRDIADADVSTEIASDENAEWAFSGDADSEEKEYETGITSLEASICDLSYVKSVDIEPKNYADYDKQEGITLNIALDTASDIPENYQESIENYVYSTNFFDKYEFVYQ